MDVHKSMDDWILICIKIWISFHENPCSTDINCRSLHAYPCLDSTWILLWRTEDWQPKIMDIHVDNREFLEIHVCICYGFSDKGWLIYQWNRRGKSLMIPVNHCRVSYHRLIGWIRRSLGSGRLTTTPARLQRGRCIDLPNSTLTKYASGGCTWKHPSFSTCMFPNIIH